ncbi:MAG: SRPBCC domain-containing protein [Tannerellaceae bacterium]|nr:SRPBCC domain-containing protein [Tannerellaceae bacterium]
MRNEPIIIEEKINAPAERVWRAISEREEMRHWYFDITRFWPELGCDFQFNEIKNGKKYVHLCRVTDIIEKKKLGYTWKYEGIPGCSEVTFELIPADKDTLVKLTHKGVDSFAQAGRGFGRSDFEREWNRIIKRSLKNFAEREIINKSITVNADTSFVWQALTEPQFTSKWMSALKKGVTLDSDWQEDSEVLWKTADGQIIARGIVTVNHPEHYMKIHFPCCDEQSCALNPGEDYQIYMLTGISYNQCVLEVECNTFTENTAQLTMFWNQALKKIRQLSEKLAQEASLSVIYY